MIMTKGDVTVEEIKVGDIHYEFGYGFGIEVEVIELPVFEMREDGDTYASWKSRKKNSDQIIEYGVSEKYSHYGPNLYTYKAYEVSRWI